MALFFKQTGYDKFAVRKLMYKSFKEYENKIKKPVMRLDVIKYGKYGYDKVKKKHMVVRTGVEAYLSCNNEILMLGYNFWNGEVKSGSYRISNGKILETIECSENFNGFKINKILRGRNNIDKLLSIKNGKRKNCAHDDKDIEIGLKKADKSWESENSRNVKWIEDWFEKLCEDIRGRDGRDFNEAVFSEECDNGECSNKKYGKKLYKNYRYYDEEYDGNWQECNNLQEYGIEEYEISGSEKSEELIKCIIGELSINKGVWVWTKRI